MQDLDLSGGERAMKKRPDAIKYSSDRKLRRVIFSTEERRAGWLAVAASTLICHVRIYMVIPFFILS